MRKSTEIKDGIVAYVDSAQLSILPYCTAMFLDQEYRDQVMLETGDDVYCMIEIGWLFFAIQIQLKNR